MEIGGSLNDVTIRGNLLVNGTTTTSNSANLTVNNALIKLGNNNSGTTKDLGYFAQQFRVFNREGEECFEENCKGKILRIVQSGRSTFYCPKCQK